MATFFNILLLALIVATETRCETERLAREHQACSNASRRACQVRVPGRNGLRGETQLGRSAFELCESTVDVTQRQTETKVGMIDSAAFVQFHFIALRRYFVNTKNGVEKSSSTPFSIDPFKMLYFNDSLYDESDQSNLCSSFLLNVLPNVYLPF